MPLSDILRRRLYGRTLSEQKVNAEDEAWQSPRGKGASAKDGKDGIAREQFAAKRLQEVGFEKMQLVETHDGGRLAFNPLGRDEQYDRIAPGWKYDDSKRDFLRRAVLIGGAGAALALGSGMAGHMIGGARATPGDGIGGPTIGSGGDVDAKRIGGVRHATEFDAAKHAGTDADPWTRSALASALSDAGAGGATYGAPGTYNVDSQIDITSSFTTLRVDGKVRLTGGSGTAGFRLGNENGSILDFLAVSIHRIDGQGKANNRDGVLIRNCQQSVTQIDDILGCRYGLHFRQMTDAARWAENSFYYRDIHSCTKAIYFQNPDAGVGTPVAHEGTELWGGSIFTCDAGLEVDTTVNCGGIWVTGVIDNAAVGGSTDYVNGGGSALGNILALKYLREASSTLHPEDVVMAPNFAALRTDLTPILVGPETAGTKIVNETGSLVIRARGPADASRILLRETADVTKVGASAAAAALQIYGGTQEVLIVSALKDTRFDLSISAGSGSLRPLAINMGAQLVMQFNTDGTIRINNAGGSERIGLRQGTAGNRGVFKTWDATLGAYRYAYIDNGAWVIATTEPT